MPTTKPCPPGQIRSPTTNRCIKVDGKAAKDAFAKVEKSVPKTKTKTKTKINTKTTTETRNANIKTKTKSKTSTKTKSKTNNSNNAGITFSKYKNMLKTLLDFQSLVLSTKIGLVGEENEYIIKCSNAQKYKVIRFSRSKSSKKSSDYTSIDEVLDSFKKVNAMALLIANDKLNNNDSALYLWKA